MRLLPPLRLSCLKALSVSFTCVLAVAGEAVALNEDGSDALCMIQVSSKLLPGESWRALVADGTEPSNLATSRPPDRGASHEVDDVGSFLQVEDLMLHRGSNAGDPVPEADPRRNEAVAEVGLSAWMSSTAWPSEPGRRPTGVVAVTAGAAIVIPLSLFAFFLTSKQRPLEKVPAQQAQQNNDLVMLSCDRSSRRSQALAPLEQSRQSPLATADTPAPPGYSRPRQVGQYSLDAVSSSSRRPHSIERSHLIGSGAISASPPAAASRQPHLICPYFILPHGATWTVPDLGRLLLDDGVGPFDILKDTECPVLRAVVQPGAEGRSSSLRLSVIPATNCDLVCVTAQSPAPAPAGAPSKAPSLAAPQQQPLRVLASGEKPYGELSRRERGGYVLVRDGVEVLTMVTDVSLGLLHISGAEAGGALASAAWREEPTSTGNATRKSHLEVQVGPAVDTILVLSCVLATVVLHGRTAFDETF